MDLSGSGLKFISARAFYGRLERRGEVVCETVEQCNAVAEWAVRAKWEIATRVATDDEIADAKRWDDLW